VKGSSRRPEQVGETIRQVVADALTRGELRDPRIGLVTVTRVEVSGDRSHARVFVSPQGDEAERARAMEGLTHASGYFRSLVAKVLTTRSVPELHLELDRGLEHAQRIEQLLAEIKRGERP